MLDFFYMLTKLQVKLCEAVCKLFILNVNISHSEMHSSQSLPEDDVDKEEAEEAYASECHEIRKAISLTITIPLLHLHDKLTCPFGQANLLPESLDLSSLITMQFQHQTQHAAKAVRTQGSTAIANSDPNSLNSPQQQKQKGESV